MAQTNITNTTTSNMRLEVPDYSVSPATLDVAGASEETTWENLNWKTYLGYYKKIPELKKAIDALATWTAGKGWAAEDIPTKLLLEHIQGWGEDSFQSIMENMIIVKKINGDAYAEIIKDNDGAIINIKPLSPDTMRTVVDRKGMIIRYEEIAPGEKEAKRELKPERILHLVNDRIANEIHGTSVVEACQWVIDARNEAMADKRRLLHRSTIRIIEVDSEDTIRLTTLKTQYAEAIKYGEVLLVPKDNVSFPNVPPISTSEHSEWIRYLENFFYQAVGVPKIILGGAQEFTEASSKVGYLTFEPVYTREQAELEADLWNQLSIRIRFNRPPSLSGVLQSDEEKNTGQTGIQDNEMMLQMGRTE